MKIGYFLSSEETAPRELEPTIWSSRATSILHRGYTRFLAGQAPGTDVCLDGCATSERASSASGSSAMTLSACRGKK